MHNNESLANLLNDPPKMVYRSTESARALMKWNPAFQDVFLYYRNRQKNSLGGMQAIYSRTVGRVKERRKQKYLFIEEQ